MIHTDNQIIVVKQSNAISGSILVEGAKNAILPIIPAALLAKGVSRITQVPDSQDVYKMIELITFFGAQVSFCTKKGILEIDSTNLRSAIVPTSLYQTMRASILVAGAILSRLKEIWIGLPGGDRIGRRPIDLHLDGFKAMGAAINNLEEQIHINAQTLNSTDFFFDYPSVGATQNILLAAASCEGTTTLYNAAQEPEVLDLIEVLTKMGAKITHESPATIKITGSKNLVPFDHAIMPDRLEAGTLLIAAAITKGGITIANAPGYAMQSLTKKLQAMGHIVEIGKHGYGISLIAAEKPTPVNLKTMPYPGFATDLQSPMMALLACTPGSSIIHETVFESRMAHAYELNKMGAKITVEYDCAKIQGVSQLYGAEIEAADIRSCASLVIAGLAAEGTTYIKGVSHLLRGYQRLDEKLRSLGGNVFITEYSTSNNESLLLNPVAN